MYDIQTILSAYDKQGTLVQWLKNLDTTLKESGLESVKQITVEGGYKLKFTFANGVVLESDLITKIDTLDINAEGVKLAVTAPNGITVEYNGSSIVDGKTINSNIRLLLPIKGSESVIVDVAENGTAIEIHLDTTLLNDITRALKMPVGTIPETELVAVTPTNEQKMLSLGTGLKIENDTLSADGTGSGVITIDIMQTGASGTLTAEQVGLIVDNFPNVNIRLLGQDIFMPLEYTENNYKFAKVQTSDTQAETKLFNVNATTNTWTFTQYLVDLGVISWKKVTASELKNYMTSDNIGRLVKCCCKSLTSSSSENFHLKFNSFVKPIGYVYDVDQSTRTFIGIKYDMTIDFSSSVNTLIFSWYYALISTEGVKSYIRKRYVEIDFSAGTMSSRLTNTFVAGISDSNFDFYIEE